MKICLFVYDFPHRKSTDFMTFLLSKGYQVSIVVGAPYKELPSRSKTVRTKVKGSCNIEPSELAKALKLNYVSMSHDSSDLPSIIKEHDCNVGIIGGARILKSHVISCFEFGIINFHPGRLPKVRGLETVLWSIKKKTPFAVTSHLIDRRVDAGKILEINDMHLSDDDTIYDVSEKLYSLQLSMISSSLDKAFNRKYAPIDITEGVNPLLTYEESLELVNQFKVDS